jgi:dihydroorotate dehydrogenase
MPKRDLDFRTPIMNAAGTLGFAPDLHAPVNWDALGAFVTNPLSLRPRRAAAEPGVLEFAGGILLHTGLPNPGLASATIQYARRWGDASLPVIVHLMADRPEETQQMVRSIESVENVAAAELGFAPLLAEDILLLTLELCVGELPLIFCLPADQVLPLGPRLIDGGAQAISLAAPRGRLRAGTGANAPFLEGRLFGRALLPQSLELVHNAARLGLPIIGAGGVDGEAEAQAMLSSGALAVQMDASLWRPGNQKVPRP